MFSRSPCRLVSHPFTQLLEDHLQQLREEEGVDLGDDDDESMWQGWDVESDDSDSDSEDEEWINVDDSDNNDLIISDSEDEAEKAKAPQEDATSNPSRISTLATTKVRIICPPFI